MNTVDMYEQAKYLTNEQIKHIWLEVRLGRGRHGSFLKAVADAITMADNRNFCLLRPISKVWIVEYSLDKYLDNFKSFEQIQIEEVTFKLDQVKKHEQI